MFMLSCSSHRCFESIHEVAVLHKFGKGTDSYLHCRLSVCSFVVFFLKNIIFACGNEDHSTIIPQV
jgi:hypothetical protein